MNCRRIKRLIPLAVGGDLPPRKQSRVLSHLERCSGCREEYRSFSQVLESTRAWLRDEREEWQEGEWKQAVRSASAGKPGILTLAPWPFRRVWAFAVMAASAAFLFLFIIRPGFIKKRSEVRSSAGIHVGTTDQEILQLTFVSHETGLQIQWFFNKDFEWKENNK